MRIDKPAVYSSCDQSDFNIINHFSIKNIISFPFFLSPSIKQIVFVLIMFYFLRISYQPNVEYTQMIIIFHTYTFFSSYYTIWTINMNIDLWPQLNAFIWNSDLKNHIKSNFSDCYCFLCIFLVVVSSKLLEKKFV